MSFKAETNKELVNKHLEQVKKKFFDNLEKSLKSTSLFLVGYLRKDRLRGGTTDTKLRRRSGRLSAGTSPLPVERKTDKVEGGIGFGTKYARVHIGPKGQVTTIKPKTKKYLTIPIEGSPILTKGGVLKASAKELMEGGAGLPFADTFIKKSKKGNLVIFGTYQVTKGSNIGKKRGGIVPLFLLRKEVKIKTRIHPEEITKMARTIIADDLKKRRIATNA